MPLLSQDEDDLVQAGEDATSNSDEEMAFQLVRRVLASHGVKVVLISPARMSRLVECVGVEAEVGVGVGVGFGVGVGVGIGVGAGKEKGKVGGKQEVGEKGGGKVGGKQEVRAKQLTLGSVSVHPAPTLKTFRL